MMKLIDLFLDRLKKTICLLGLLLLTACAVKPRVTSDFDTNYNFLSLKTYAWLETSKDQIVSLDAKRQANAIETILNRNGFKKAEQLSSADFLVNLYLVTEKKTEVESFSHPWGLQPSVMGPYFYGWPHNSTTLVREYTLGTLILDFIDADKKQAIWRGTLSSPVSLYKDQTPQQRTSLAMANAELLLERFPPVKESQ